MQTATLFDIQHGSYVDGPGIRTTLFFKGCNLRCAWCHNPEGQSFDKQIMLFQNKCTNCGKCAEVCPHHLETCDFCEKCELFCPNDAREICGEELSVDEIFAEILKDKAYYDTSSGGATFSGGESMLQIGFMEEILKKCKSHDIHTAVDTAGAVSWMCFEKILPYTDLFLYDIKAITPTLHRTYTGVDNRLILENFKKLYEQAARIIVRIPVIGGFNDSEEEMQKIKDFLKAYPSAQVELMPYHAMGVHKYKALGYTTKAFYVPPETQMNHWRELFQPIQQGIRNRP